MPPEVEPVNPLYDVATNDIIPTQAHFRERAGKVMFSIGGTTFVGGSLGVLIALMCQSPEWANVCGQAAVAGGILSVPPAMLGYLPGLGEVKSTKPHPLLDH